MNQDDEPMVPEQAPNSSLIDQEQIIESKENTLATIAYYYYEKADYIKAIQFYTKTIQINQNVSRYFNERSKCYQGIHAFELALKDAETYCEMTQIDENKSETVHDRVMAHYSCGCLLAELGKEDDTKLLKAENRIKAALRICKNKQFLQEINIKYKRLKKLIWYKQREKDISLTQLEKTLISNAYNRGQISAQQFEQLNAKINEKFRLLTTPLEIPDHFICKITLQLMIDPVITQEGFTYERSALKKYLTTLYQKGQEYSDPISKKTIRGTFIRSFTVKTAIDDFLEHNPWGFEFNEKQYHDIRMI